MNIRDSVLLKLNIIREFGFSCGPGSFILDFGCGSGQRVQILRDLGFQAFGCDFEFKTDEKTDTEGMRQNGFIRLINPQKYVLPFEDGSFDLVFSDQVFEHVQNYPESISEIARVLKSDGTAFHIFPPRYTPIEPHVYVPLGTIIQSYWWLHLWALLGVRKKDQKGLSAKDTATANFRYLTNKTHYLPKARISREFRHYFRRVVFGERAFLKHSRRGKYLHILSTVFPFLPSLYSAFRSRVLVAQTPIREIAAGTLHETAGTARQGAIDREELQRSR
jgi:SAM-dependent methyltransferase